MRPEPSGYYILEASGVREATTEEVEAEYGRFEPLPDLITKDWVRVDHPGVKELLHASRKA